MTLLASRGARAVALLVVVSILASCGLPRIGPNRNEIFAGSVQREGDAFVVEVNSRVTQATSVVEALGFTSAFLNAGVTNTDVIRPGDLLTLTIYENVEDGLLAGAGGNAGGTSFGNYCSASGGYGANRNNQHSGGLGGVGSGGTLNIYGGGGQPHHTRSSVGGQNFWGGAVAAGHPQGGHFSHRHESHASPGAGGSGGYFTGHRGANGRNGMVVVVMYY